MLLQYEKENIHANEILSGTLLKENMVLTPVQKSFVKKLFNGCIERKLTLSYVISLYSSKKEEALKPVIRNVLYMGIYQILYMDGVPDFSAVNECVRLVQKKGITQLKGFVNGILRNISRDKDNVLLKINANEETRFSIPSFLNRHFGKICGYDSSVRRSMYESFLSEKPVTVRIRPVISKDKEEKLVKSWESEGLLVQSHPYLERMYEIRGGAFVTDLNGFDEGFFYVMDAGSALIGKIAGIKGGEEILDVCASPGGKSIYAADCLMAGGKGGRVVSRDVSEYKTDKINENANRLKINCIFTEVRDGRVYNPEDEERYDVVLLDVPCSGLGVIGRKADIKYNVSEQSLKDITKLQKEIIDTCVRYVKRGGILIYSTCTINPYENEKQKEYILQKGFAEDAVDEYLPDMLREGVQSKGSLQLLPGIHKTDGFYMARLRKE